MNNFVSANKVDVSRHRDGHSGVHTLERIGSTASKRSKRISNVIIQRTLCFFMRYEAMRKQRNSFGFTAVCWLLVFGLCLLDIIVCIVSSAVWD